MGGQSWIVIGGASKVSIAGMDNGAYDYLRDRIEQIARFSPVKESEVCGVEPVL